MNQIDTGMDADAGGSDTVAPGPMEAVAQAMAHLAEMEMDTHGLGSTIGDVMGMPMAPDDDSTILEG